MVKKLLIGACLVLTLVACTTAPTIPDAKSPVVAANNGPPLGCVNGTGTRLKVSPTDCTAIGMTHTKTSVDATGKVWAQQSLYMIDTAVKINGSAQ